MSKIIEIYRLEDKKAEYEFSDDFKKLENITFIANDFMLDDYDKAVNFLKSRMIDLGRPNRTEMLGIPKNTVLPWYKELGRTFGFDPDDLFWVRVPSEIPEDRKHWRIADFHWKVNPNAMGVYFG